MSNKLKTLSVQQLETLISQTIGNYLDEECECKVTNIDTPYINSEEDIAIEHKRSLNFEVELTYLEDE
jgi:hypothetical protein